MSSIQLIDWNIENYFLTYSDVKLQLSANQYNYNMRVQNKRFIALSKGNEIIATTDCDNFSSSVFKAFMLMYSYVCYGGGALASRNAHVLNNKDKTKTSYSAVLAGLCSYVYTLSIHRMHLYKNCIHSADTLYDLNAVHLTKYLISKAYRVHSNFFSV